MDHVIKVGFIGLGLAVIDIIPQVMRNRKVKVTAVCDVRKEAVDEFVGTYDGVKGYYTVEDLCKDQEVEMVYICTPNHMHCEHAIIAAEHKKHIIVEKPMALTLEECETMNQAVERNGVKLLCGHTHSFDAPIIKMQEIVASGELGRLMMINTWDFTDFMYRPRMPHELDTSKGGGAVFIQAPHSVDIIRQIAGLKLRSVRGMTGVFDPVRKTEGMYVAFLDFEDGTPATCVYNGYSHFDISELYHWVGEVGKKRRDPYANYQMRALLKNAEDEAQLKADMRFGGPLAGEWERLTMGVGEELPNLQPHFGLTIVSCEHGDIRQTERGLKIYGNDRIDEVPLPSVKPARDLEIDEMYDAIVYNRPVFHDGRWGQATLEVCHAIYESTRERKEIILKYQ